MVDGSNDNDNWQTVVMVLILWDRVKLLMILGDGVMILIWWDETMILIVWQVNAEIYILNEHFLKEIFDYQNLKMTDLIKYINAVLII